MPSLPDNSAGQIALAAVLAIAAFYLLLPKPRVRSKAGGAAAAIASVAVFGVWLFEHFGRPTQDLIGTVLFVLFSLGALVNGVILVAQRNPARGAISFAFVILSTCGLFLLLAAPFLMAATIIIYAGAIIVTFLFVLMLSHAGVRSDENDRSREPMLGSLAGFAFVGLILFTLYKNAPQSVASDKPTPPLPAAILTVDEEVKLEESVKAMDGAIAALRSLNTSDEAASDQWLVGLNNALVPSFHAMNAAEARLRLNSPAPLRVDPQARGAKARIDGIRASTRKLVRKIQEAQDGMQKFDTAAIETEVAALRDEIRLLRGSVELPARNVANIGYILYADQLLAVELAGTLLLVATIGAVAIASRREVVA